MVQILVNLRQVRPIEPIEGTITSLIIVSMGQTPIPSEMTKPIVDWIYDIAQRVEGQITFNNTIIDKKDVKNITDAL